MHTPGKLTKSQAYRMAKDVEGDTGAAISSSDIMLEVATPPRHKTAQGFLECFAKAFCKPPHIYIYILLLLRICVSSGIFAVSAIGYWIRTAIAIRTHLPKCP